MKTSAFINDLATQAGIATDTPEFKTLLSDAVLNEKDIPDDIANKIRTGFLTVESAKQNPELKKHFTAQALNGVDTEIEALMKTYEIPDDLQVNFKSEKSSYKKIALLASTIKDLQAKKTGATKEDKDKLALVISGLNEELRITKENAGKKENELLGQMKDARTGWELNSIYNALNYALPTTKEANIKVAKSLVDDELAKLGIRIVNKEDSLQLETKEGTEYFDKTNKKVAVKDFIDSTLAQHKVLVVNDPKKTTAPVHQQNSNGNGNGNGNGSGPKTGKFDSKMSELLDDAMKE